ncbi:MAG: hypothetical protein JOZ84_08890 [Methylobacteriaceae bacterium]|nr:hypothetical protein [Methylobacteriaceae bacterium]
MAINVTINVSESADQPRGVRVAHDGTESLSAELDALRAYIADDIAPFPPAGIDSFLSHFVIAVQFLEGERKGQVVPFTLEPAVQTVARSHPFIYGGAVARHEIGVAVPAGSKLRATITEADFHARPAKFFEAGKEHIWLQILNLDAHGETSLGPIRAVLGETLRSNYEDIFVPSLGLAQSLGKTGFPARFFFSPVAVFETPFGAFRTRPGKTLQARRIVEIPPIGSVSIAEAIPLDHVDAVRAAAKGGRHISETPPAARLVALAHPIDAALHLPGEEAFRTVQARIR